MLYLASKSPRRRQLLEQVGIRFGTVDVDVPETRVVDPLPYSKWYRDYLVANDVPGAVTGITRTRVA